MTPTLILAIAWSQAVPTPEALVLLTRRSGASMQVADEVARELRKALSYAGVESPIPPDQLGARLQKVGIKDPKGCQGEPECAIDLGKRLKVPTVVALGVTHSGEELLVRIEAFNTATAARIEFDQFVIGSNEMGGLFTALAPFSSRLREQLAPTRKAPRAPAVGVAPFEDFPARAPAPTFVPATAPDAAPPQAVVFSPPPPSRLPIYVTSIAAVVVGASSAALLGVGLTAKGQVDRRVDAGGALVGSPLTHAQAQSIANTANAELTGSLGLGLGSLALGTVATILLATAPSP